MSEQTTSQADAEAAGSDIARRTATVAVLSGMVAVSLAAEATGFTHDMPSVAKTIVNSGAHPLLGYVGAWAANTLSGNPVGRAKARIALLGASVADIVTEAAQSALIASPEYVDFLSSRNLPETAKDYVFALGGMALYLWQDRRQNG